MVTIGRRRMGLCAGVLGVIDVLFLWGSLSLPPSLTPRIGFGFGFTVMTAGVILTGVAAVLQSRWWLLAVAGAIATFVIFSVAVLS